MLRLVAMHKCKQKVIQFALLLQPRLRQGAVIRCSVVVWSSGTVGRWACEVGEKTNLLVSFGSEVACVGLQVCLFFVCRVSICRKVGKNSSAIAKSLCAVARSLRAVAKSLYAVAKSPCAVAISLRAVAKSLCAVARSPCAVAKSPCAVVRSPCAVVIN